jgi:ABC-type multidrug transport system ATPase subunit
MTVQHMTAVAPSEHSGSGAPAVEKRGGYAIETAALTKRYGARVVAVRSLNMKVRRGEVYGFLGPNGAGKTTTLRMLVGLIRPTAGDAKVLGRAPGSSAALARVGAMIEEPAFYPYLSGYDNLRVLALHAGIPPARIGVVLERVLLAGRAGDRFGSYSMGMKQRLGVAAALLKDPELLILDEPTNGLDPAGMADMRRLIRGLAQDGRTVLLSSHLLGEVEQICDRLGVIREGVLVAEGTLDGLRGRGSLRVRAEPLDEARRVVAGLLGAGLVSAEDGYLRVAVEPEQAPRINRALVQAGVAVEELCQERTSLEELFLELTGKEAS